MGDQNADPMDALMPVADGFWAEADSGFRALPEKSRGWQAMQAALTELEGVVATATKILPALRQDLSKPHEFRVAEFDQYHAAADAQAKAIIADTAALLRVVEAELQDGAMPKLDPKREAFVREDIRIRLQNAGKDTMNAVVAMANGPDRQQAAAITGPFGEALIRSLLPDDASGILKGLRGQALWGSERFGSPQEQKYALALKGTYVKAQQFRDTRMQVALSKLNGLVRYRP